MKKSAAAMNGNGMKFSNPKIIDAKIIDKKIDKRIRRGYRQVDCRGRAARHRRDNFEYGEATYHSGGAGGC